MKYTFIKQHDETDCAAACLAMICLHYKKETTIMALRDIMGTDLKGTNLIGIKKAADELGFISEAVRVNREGFRSKFTLPCIANVVTKEGLSHFVVVFKIKKDYVIIGDPADDLKKVTFEEFYKSFTGVLFVLSPDKKFNESGIDSRSTFNRFIKILLPQKKLFIYSIITSLLMTVLGIGSSFFNKILMDEILPYKLDKTLLVVVIIFGIVSITQMIITFMREWIMLLLSQKIDIPLLIGYFEHIYKLPMKFFASRKTGDIITRFSDAFTIKNIFTNIALTLIMDVTMALITGVILFRMNSGLFGIIILLTIMSILLIFIFKHPYKKINEEQMQQESRLNSQIIEGLSSIENIKSNVNEENELNSIEKEYIKSLRISYKEGMLSNIQNNISSAVIGLGNLILMYVGIKQVLNNNITLGSFMAFSTLSSYFMDPVSRLVSLQLEIQEATISLRRLTEILDYEGEQENSDFEQIDEIKGDIEFKDVTFRYGTRSPVLKNISFKVGRGQKVAIVGESGSGKSTIAKLLLKYYEVEDGLIKVDGININELDNKSVRKAISYVPQNIELFSKTVYDNIRISKMNSSLDEVKEAAIKANADEFIKKLPLKYNTYLEENGNGLSGGEKQRIGLARAFLKDSGLYVFDESTSSLDFLTENTIFNMIYNKLKKKTVIIIAHRLSTIKQCDEILVVDKGEIIERGTHEELLKNEGRYSRLWRMQQGDFYAEDNNEKDEHDIEIDEDEISYE